MRTKLIIRTFGFLLLLMAVPFLGCDHSIGFPTGINGVAILEQGGGNINPPPPITDVPLAGAIISIQPQNGGPEITREIADSKGGFKFDLPPGSYLVIAQGPPDQSFLLAPPQQTVVVSPHKMSQLIFTFTTVSHF